MTTTSVFLPGESHGQRSLQTAVHGSGGGVGWDVAGGGCVYHKELDMTEET